MSNTLFSLAFGVGSQNRQGAWLEVFYAQPLVNPSAELIAAGCPAVEEVPILLDLGVRDMIVMSSTRPEPTALEGYGLRIVGWRDMDGEEQS